MSSNWRIYWGSYYHKHQQSVELIAKTKPASQMNLSGNNELKGILCRRHVLKSEQMESRATAGSAADVAPFHLKNTAGRRSNKNTAGRRSNKNGRRSEIYKKRRRSENYQIFRQSENYKKFHRSGSIKNFTGRRSINNADLSKMLPVGEL